MENLRNFCGEFSEASICKPILSKLEEYEERYFANQNKFQVKFPFELRTLQEKDFSDSNCERKDLRNLDCFTIDCDRTKDMDDGCSLTYENGIYHLGVHIADVSEYVKFGSSLDEEAMKRGNSIYLPNLTVNMLPPILSENLCSLNADCDRKTLSVLFDIDSSGNVLSYSVTKGLIHSRIKGVYSEINSIFDGKASDDVLRKYESVKDSLVHMNNLAKVLRKKRAEEGADISDSSNGPDIVFLDDRVEIIPRKPGVSEEIIEEFMSLANRYVAQFMNENNIPAIYRVQNAVGELAEYVPFEKVHASLNLKKYVHYTSPIRRLADLRNHQMISAYLMGAKPETLHFLFDNLMERSSDIATKRERSSNDLYKTTSRMCYIEYFKNHPGRHAGKVIAVVNGKSVIRLEGNDICVVCNTCSKIGQRVSVNICLTDKQLFGFGLKAA